MKAIFKSEDTLIVNSADSTERLLANAFVEKANEEGHVFEVSKLVDINGDIAGMLIELKDEPAPTPEPTPEEPEEGESNITNPELEDNTKETDDTQE